MASVIFEGPGWSMVYNEFKAILPLLLIAVRIFVLGLSLLLPHQSTSRHIPSLEQSKGALSVPTFEVPWCMRKALPVVCKIFRDRWGRRK